jgi:hypothetical protein
MWELWHLNLTLKVKSMAQKSYYLDNSIFMHRVHAKVTKGTNLADSSGVEDARFLQPPASNAGA